MMDFEQWNLDHDQLKQIADSLEKIAACVDGREDSRFFSVGGEMDICR